MSQKNHPQRDRRPTAAVRPISEAAARREYWLAEVENLQAEAGLFRKTQDLIDAELKEYEAAWGVDAMRTWDFVDEVTQESVTETVHVLDHWLHQSSDPITIRLASPGGDVIYGLALYDLLMARRAEGATINVVVLGYAASMAGYILQAGTERIMGSSAHVLIHEITTADVGNRGLTKAEDEVTFCQMLTKRCDDIMLNRTRPERRSELTRAFKRRRANDWWIDATTVMYFGLADRVLEVPEV